MHSFFVDLHIHLGATITGKPVKITASKTLTLENVLNESADIKGLNLVGIIDCHVPEVLEEIENLIKLGNVREIEGGGLCYKNKISFILGSEIEVYDSRSKGPIHVLVYFSNISQMKQFSSWFSSRVSNITLSSQRIYEEGQTLQRKVKELEGLFIPAHVFTPFKSLYGKGVEKSLTEVFIPKLIDAIELGLSSDSSMASQVKELNRYTFLTNSDAHSLSKIAREYQKVKMAETSFSELKLALNNLEGRKIETNYGLDPRLGKYYQTTCEQCYHQIVAEGINSCPTCGHRHLIRGVSSRIKELAEIKGDHYKHRDRPPYIHQVPLQFIPTLGPKTLYKLRQSFGTEMNIIHNVQKEQLAKVVSKKIADYIAKARSGQLSFAIGGGGKYGKVK